MASMDENNALGHLLSRRTVKRSNRAGNLTKSVSLILAVTAVLLAILFQSSIDRMLSELTRIISQPCVRVPEIDSSDFPKPTIRLAGNQIISYYLYKIGLIFSKTDFLRPTCQIPTT